MTITFVIDPSTAHVQGGFEVTLPWFPAYNTVVPVGDLTSCNATSPIGDGCLDMYLVTDTDPLIDPPGEPGDNFDAVGFGYDGGARSYFYFSNGAFSGTGVFTTNGPGSSTNIATLTITGTADDVQPPQPPIDFFPSDPGNGGGGAVPEPATWAMMLLGFFGLGSVVRRRRAALA